MLNLKNQTILILSPQAWGKMFVSKHHYAIELAKLGNKVYFLNPPDQAKMDRVESIEVKASGIHSNLYLVEHCLFFPYVLKFKARSIFHWLMKFHINKLLKKIGQSVDIIWSFDLGNLYPFYIFGEHPFKIFHPVDEPLNTPAIMAAKGANIIFSVTKEILDKYDQFNIPKHFINHGVTDDFINLKPEEYQKNIQLRIGFSGNLLRTDIDRLVFLRIIDENPECIFECWGSYETSHSNIRGGYDKNTLLFIDTLKSKRNVLLKGVVSSAELAQCIQKMDAFLICYDVQRDQSKGTNYHKIMEYLGTGKLIVSNNVTTYQGKGLIEMVAERDNNELLPVLFKNCIKLIDSYNSNELQSTRIQFASANTYKKQLERIEKFLNEA